MNKQSDPFEPSLTAETQSDLVAGAPLLTVSQAYEYLITEGLPRSKKTIRKWCRLNHVEQKQNVIAGGPKWLITKTSLDARIAEERLIDVSLGQQTGLDRSEPNPGQTSANPSAPVRDDELVDVLKQQLAHEREARKASEEKNRDLITMYHEIALASTQVGIEIGRGMQEQGKARQLGGDDEPGSNRAEGMPTRFRTVSPERIEKPDAERDNAAEEDHDGDNHGDNDAPETRILKVQ